jgi:hypothetical protein
MLLLPFEPLAPLASVFGLQVSHLEVAAFLLLGASAAGIASRRPSPRIPLAAPLVFFFAAFLVPALFAEGSFLLPLKFTARMAAAASHLVASSALSLAPRWRPTRVFLAEPPA